LLRPAGAASTITLCYNILMPQHRPRIGVLRGGPSAEYEVSLQTGAAILDELRNRLNELYEARDIFIDKKGIWHQDGVAFEPRHLGHRVDVAFNALHGAYGEDGKIQSILESHGFPFTGSGSLASAVAMNKALSKKIFKDHGIKTPYWKEVPSERITNEPSELSRELFESLILPVVIKPSSSGSSVGVTIVRSYGELIPALNNAASHGDVVLIEEFIPGIEATAGVIEGFRGQELYALPPIEIRPHNGYFDYAAKYEGKSDEIVPATFSDKIKRSLEDLSRTVHKMLGLRHYSRTDFIIHPRRGIYVLEVNTLPGLTKESLLPKSLRAVGSDVHELVGHLVELARK